MRQARIRGAGHLGAAYYHCVSRVVDRQFHFGDKETQQFVEVLRRWEAFCGVQVVTYCVMSNHFHILVEVPAPPANLPTDEELIAKVEAASGVVAAGNLRQMLERLRAQCGPETVEAEVAAVRGRVLRRMWDVSEFMKAVKQQFTQWFNRTHQRRGTLWEGRFHSVLVEGAPAAGAGKASDTAPSHRGGSPALATIACYIDLNPVRAGIAQAPEDYRWSGYAEAVAGGRQARAGLRVAVGLLTPGMENQSWSRVKEVYDRWQRQEGVERRDGEGRVVRRGMRRVKPTLGEALRRRVRYFCDGAVFGSRAFVDAVFHEQRWRFGPRRTSGARPLRQIQAPGLHVLRDLRVNVLGAGHHEESDGS